MAHLAPPPKEAAELQDEGNPDPFGIMGLLGLRQNAPVSNSAQTPSASPSTTSTSTALGVPTQFAQQQVQQQQELTPEQRALLEERAIKMQEAMEEKLNSLPPAQRAVLVERQKQLTQHFQQQTLPQAAGAGASDNNPAAIVPANSEQESAVEDPAGLGLGTRPVPPPVAAPVGAPAVPPSPDMILIHAVRSGEIAKVAEMLAEMHKGSDYVARHATEPNGYPLLHWAILEEQLDMSRFLLRGVVPEGVENVPALPRGSLKCDINKKNHRGETALHWASLTGRIRSVFLLLDEGADMKAVDAQGYSALHHAAQHGQSQILAVLHRRGMAVDLRDANGRTPLHWAAYKDEDLTVMWLLDHGADLYAEDWEKCLPIHWTALRGNLNMAKLLMRTGGAEGCDTQLDARDNTHANAEELALGKVAKFPAKSYEARRWERVAKYFADCKKVGGDPRSSTRIKWPHFSWFIWPVLAPIAWYTYYTVVFPVTSHLTILTFIIWVCYWMKWFVWMRLQTVDPGFLVVRPEDKSRKCFGHASGKTTFVKYQRVPGEDSFNDTRGGGPNDREETSLSVGAALDSRASMPNPRIPDSMRYREMYDMVLDRGLDVPICTSCEIVKPLRSKHDRVTNRCVASFDHYCPWMSVAIGELNYFEFFFSMFFAMFTIWAWLALCVAYTGLVDESKSWFSNFINHFLFQLFAFVPFVPIALYAVLMVGQHAMFIKMNLTTNETMNRFRYRYLMGGNPFDQGGLKNLGVFLRLIKPKVVDVRDYFGIEFSGGSAKDANAEYQKKAQEHMAEMRKKRGGGHGHSHGGGGGGGGGASEHGHSHGGGKSCKHGH